LTNGTSYAFRVSAISAIGAGIASDTVSATPVVDPTGELDTTFSDDGKIALAIGSGDETASDVAIDSNGRIVVVGYTHNGSDNDIFVIRFNSDGSLDTTFDGDGIVQTDLGSSDDYAYGVALDSDGKIVVVGQTNAAGTHDGLVLRYESDGSLDDTFDADGKVTTDIDENTDFYVDVELQDDGKIVVVGSAWNSEGTQRSGLLTRYNTDGSLDTSFAAPDGFGLITDPDDYHYDVNSLKIQDDGKIIAVLDVSDVLGVIDRFDANVSAYDTTFSEDGADVVLWPMIGSAIQTDGSIVVSGYVSDLVVKVTRYTSTGEVDSNFASAGTFSSPLEHFVATYSDALIQNDGKLLIPVTFWNGSAFDFGMYRLAVDGSLDTTFNGDGLFSASLNSGSDFPWNAVLQDDGKIVLVGDTNNGSDFDIAIMRFK
jgi:uncharacterized delta-60 repeat protein